MPIAGICSAKNNGWNTLHLRFEGPFSWRSDTGVPCIFSETLGKQSGIYIWTIPVGCENLVYDVGETGRSFVSRHEEHLREHMAGFYHLFDRKSLLEGRKHCLWNGLYGRNTRESVQDLFSRWAELAVIIEEQTRIVQFYLAALDASPDVRKEIERELATHFANSPRNFQDGGVWYRDGNGWIVQHAVHMTASRPIIDLPTELQIGGDALGGDAPLSRVFITPYGAQPDI